MLALLMVTFGSCQPRPRPAELVLAPFSTAIDYAPYYVARANRWFEADSGLAGIRIVYGAPFNSLDEISAALGSNSLHALFAAEPPAIFTSASGRDIRIVELSCTLTQEIVVRSSLPIRSVRDLRGRRIAVLLGTSSYYGLLRTLESQGISRDSVSIEPLGPGDAKAAFEAGRIDAWAVWPPFVEEQQVAGRGRVVRGGDAVIQSIVAIPASLLRDQPNVATALVRVLERAKRYLVTNPIESQRIVAEAAGIDSQVVAAAWPKHDWAARLDSSVIRDIQNKADFLAAERQTRGSRRLDVGAELIDTSIVSRVRRGR